MENKNYLKYVKYLFSSFDTIGYKVGNCVNMFQWITFHARELGCKQEQIQSLNIVLFNLAENGYFEPIDEQLHEVKLTELGFAYTQDEVVVANQVKLSHYVEVNNTNSFSSLWSLIGKEDTAPFYVTGPAFYNTIQPFIHSLPPTYFHYMEDRNKKGLSSSRSLWFKELWESLSIEDKGSFLGDLSRAIHTLYDGNIIVDNSSIKQSDLTSACIISKAENVIKMDNKIFISHSTDDKAFAVALVDFLEKFGFGSKEIFCSSVPGYWVKENSFCDEIKRQFNRYDLYVIFIHSPRFYNSHIALNEMGAAWVLQNKHYSFLTKDMSFDDMDGLINSSEISCKVDTDEAKDRLLDFMKDLTVLFDKEFEVSKWERRRDTFLHTVNSIKYSKLTIQGGLSDFDVERMKKWVNSNDVNFFQAWEEGGDAIFGLGAINQYKVHNGKEMAEWHNFLKRMQQYGYIERIGALTKHPEYRLTKSAFEKFKD